MVKLLVLFPIPESKRVTSGVSGSFEVTMRVAVFDPFDKGVKITPIVLQHPSGVIIGVLLPHGFGPAFISREKFVSSDKIISEMLSAASPLLNKVIIIGSDNLFTFKLPKS